MKYILEPSPEVTVEHILEFLEPLFLGEHHLVRGPLVSLHQPSVLQMWLAFPHVGLMKTWHCFRGVRECPGASWLWLALHQSS